MGNAAGQTSTVKIPKLGNPFFDAHAADAIESQRATGVPASVTLAQAALESAWGKSGLSTKYHNYFGIKGKGTLGTAVMNTGEHFNGKDVVIKDGFRVYRSASESFQDHGWFFVKNKRYAEALKHKDNAERFAQEIHKAGYATDPTYSQKLIKLIRQYDLTRVDAIARSQGSVVATTGTTPKPATNTASTGSGQASPGIEELQGLLIKYGYMTVQEMKTGPGLLGPKTRAALTKFLEADGRAAPTSAKNTAQVTPGNNVIALTSTKGETPKPATTTSSSNQLSYAKISANMRAKIPGSRHFTWHEALWLPSDHRYATSGEVTPTILANIVRQAQALDVVREHFQKPIAVHCWLRPPAYNKKVGGAKNSAHLRGAATDFHIEGYSAEQVRKVLRANKALYPGAGELNVSWLHLDLEHKAWFSPS